MSKERRLMEWMLSIDTGASSKAMVAQFEGVGLIRDHNCYPHDPADLGRCIRLLEKIPEYKNRLTEMRKKGREWSSLIDHWGEIVSLYRQEEPTGSAPKCYKRMREIIDGARVK